MGEQLQVILGNDNEARKAAEENIKNIREKEPDKYVTYLSQLCCDPAVEMQLKTLSAVILRRTLISYNEQSKMQLWEMLKPDTKTYLKSNLLINVKMVDNRDYVHKVCNLLVEIQGAMFEENEEIWQDLLNLVF